MTETFGHSLKTVGAKHRPHYEKNLQSNEIYIVKVYIIVFATEMVVKIINAIESYQFYFQSY